MLQNYGVEAARNTIISELATVFNVYGIAIDFRHLALIADYMVCGHTTKQIALVSSLPNHCLLV
jgi:hypothetical protein